MHDCKNKPSDDITKMYRSLVNHLHDTNKTEK